MIPLDNAHTEGHAGVLRRAGKAWADRCQAMIDPPASSRAAKRRLASICGALVLAGLVCALAAPALGMAGFGTPAIASVAVLGFGALLSAVAVAASGETDLAAAGLYTLLAALLAVLSVEIDSFWPLTLLAIGPVEARLAGQRLLFRLMLPAVFLGAGLVGFLSLHGLGPSDQGFAGTTLALPLITAYAGFVLHRLAVRPARETEEDRTASIVLLDAEGRVLGGAGAGSAFSQRLHLLDRVAFLKVLDAMRHGRGESELSLRLRGEEPGSFRATPVRLVPCRSAEGELLQVEAHLPEGENEPAGAEEGETSATRAQSAFLATISHELRTPLNAIIGFSELLDRETFGPFSDPRQKEYVGLIHRSGQHLLDIVNGLLDMSKIEAGRYDLAMESFSVAHVARAAAEMIGGEADRKGLRLVVRTGEPAECVTADRRVCRQILVNLLANAVKFTDAGTVCLSARVEKDELVLAVSDTGIGIAEADIARLGRPFVQLSQGPSRRYEGTGLGLSLVRGFAELHHGTMEIESQEGRGTTVTVRIPTDCAERPRFGETPPENVVALTHARQKASLSSQVFPTRRSA
ncbi:sensor histidine kinase [Aureimonas ureilytica]|uniref:sensor histidine kinase n=1 Tax=Aureimonas ureilytica TaxID=401562 RepID=UPI0003A09492|nr:HAMP domain-containing sensor histidine kinase [Aureimonas ureilytica]